MKARIAGLGLAAGLVLGPAHAEDVIKIAVIDPLSGGGAVVDTLNEFEYLADEINATGGLNGKKVEIIGLDNKGSPQESLVQAQKAADDGVHIITQGPSSLIAAAVSDWVTKYNDRNDGKEIIYLNYGAGDPALTNAKCSYWHFLLNANVNVKVAALTEFLKTRPNVKKVYLIDQDYSVGQLLRTQTRAMLKEKRPDIEIVGADAGLKTDWYMYGGGAGDPTAIKQTGLSDRVFALPECDDLRAGRGAEIGDRLSRQERHMATFVGGGQRDAHAGEGDRRG
jgi:branched-chain amino acid transport system substrate-binding protein